MKDPDFRYPGQQAEEVTKRVVYKHIFSIVPIILGLVIVGLVGMGFLVYASANPQQVPIQMDPAIYGLVGMLLVVLLALLVAAIFWIWRQNKIVITNVHLVDIDQIGLFNKKVSTLSWTRIQDVSAKVNGPLQTIFGYGTLHVQTAGEDKNFSFDYVPNPYELEHYILEMHKLVMTQDDGVSMKEESEEIAHDLNNQSPTADNQTAAPLPQSQHMPQTPPAPATSQTGSEPTQQETIAGTYIPPNQVQQAPPPAEPPKPPLPKNPLED